MIASKTAKRKLWLYIIGGVTLLFLIIFLPILFLVILKEDDKMVSEQDQIIQSLQAMKSDMMGKYTAGTVDYSDFKSDPEAYENHIIELSQSDFAGGTVKLIHKGHYKLKEDIEFEPNATNDWLPNCFPGPTFQEDYCAGDFEPASEYRLGFFAAVTMQGEDILFNLNGKTLSQTETHALQQRFYANIELADQPFILNQGPASLNADGSKFGAELISCVRCAVFNGILGRSSHHGIHGNNATSILMQDLVIEKHEVAGISAQGVRNAVVLNVTSDALDEIPTRATYSQGRFIAQSVNSWLNQLTPGDAKTEIKAKYDALIALMDAAKTEIITGDGLTTPDLIRQFGMNPSADGTHPVDGNHYGFAFACSGVIVGGFKINRECPNGALKDVVLKDSKIIKAVANIQEVYTIGDDNGPFTDTAGGTIRYDEIVDKDNGNIYIPDALHDLRFAVAWYADANGGNDSEILALKAQGRLGTFKIPAALANWASDYDTATRELDITALITTENYSKVCNSDAMHHKQKGVIGVFVQAAENFYIDNVEVDSVTNYGNGGSLECGAYGENGADHQGYTGFQTRGMIINSSKNVQVDKFTLKKAVSQYGPSYGAQFWNLEGLSFTNSEIDEVEAKNKDLTSTLPNGAIEAIPLYFNHDVKLDKFSNITLQWNE